MIFQLRAEFKKGGSHRKIRRERALLQAEEPKITNSKIRTSLLSLRTRKKKTTMAGVRHRKHSLEHWRQGGNPLICVVGHGGGFGFDSQRVMRSGRVLSKRIA